MHEETIRLLLGDVEVEVLEEALDLYLRARPHSADRRFDYRYRVAQGLLATLSGQGRLRLANPPDDDELPVRGTRADAGRRED